MAISVDPLTFVIFIPQADLTLVSGTLYTMDTDAFRLELKAYEDDIHGITFLKTHDHNTEVAVAGTTYARTIEILPPYSITFEDGQYTVILQGSNNNIFDVAEGILNQNQVQVIPTNSAGLIVVTQGSGVTEQDKIDIATAVWNDTDETDIADAVWDHTDATFLLKVVKNKKSLEKTGSVWELIIYDDNNTTPILRKDLKDKDGNNITDLEAGVLAQELKTSV